VMEVTEVDLNPGLLAFSLGEFKLKF